LHLIFVNTMPIADVVLVDELSYSTFGQIFDEKHFIDSLAHDVRIVHELPQEILHQWGNLSNIFNFRIKAWSPADYYLEKVLPKLLETGYLPASSQIHFSPLQDVFISFSFHLLHMPDFSRQEELCSL
jgi:hypothetical protein